MILEYVVSAPVAAISFCLGYIGLHTLPSPRDEALTFHSSENLIHISCLKIYTATFNCVLDGTVI